MSEFLVLVGTFTRYPVFARLGTLGIILAAIYVLFWYQRVATGPATDRVKRIPRPRAGRSGPSAPLIALIIAIGFFPRPLLDVINPAVGRTLHQVGQTDPVPSVPVSAGNVEGTAK